MDANEVNEGASFWFFALTVTGVCVAFGLGGGTRQGLFSDALIELWSLPILVCSVHQGRKLRLDGLGRTAILIAVGILSLPLLQLVPLPPWAWTALSGRGTIAAGFQAASIPMPWEPLSLDRNATWLSVLSLIPATAVFLAIMSFNDKQRRVVILVVLSFALVNFLLGLAQLAGGPESPLRLYIPTNPLDPVGLFANRNHFAVFLSIGIPLAVAWGTVRMSRSETSRRFDLVAIVLLCPVFFLGTAMAQSRAGLAFAIFGSIASVLLLAKQAKWRLADKRILIPIGLATLCTLLVVFQFGFAGFAERLESTNISDDLRWPIAQVTAHALWALFPWGSGFGTFPYLYQMFEPLAFASPLLINHAHDDWLEIASDGGMLAILLALAFLGWYAACSIRIWRARPNKDRYGSLAPMRAGAIVVFMLMAHSVVDYPLRTIALMVAFAIATSLMLPFQGTSARSRHRRAVTE